LTITRVSTGQRRFAAVALALVGLGVPTVFTVFSEEIGSSTVWLRAPIVIAWGVVVVAAAWIATGRELRLDRWLRVQATLQHERITRRSEQAFAQLLAPGALGIPDVYWFTVYVFDPSAEALVPSWPEDPDAVSIKTFLPGNGATGRAWLDDETKLVVDEDVSSDEYGLTPEQQDFFADGQVVIATPMYAFDGTPLGVLTAFSQTNDGYFETSEAREGFRDLAALVGTIVDAIAVTGEG